ncbi:unnamed protein product [Strongylus vulgaris]|uniref:Uncharacterized protein n=1 Tax=Strongylus vulgaris TaxID=40348 RepID=A0A3P7I9M9_STRVU|nr:unnamed protein product [Strongylus vulgaris]
MLAVLSKKWLECTYMIALIVLRYGIEAISCRMVDWSNNRLSPCQSLNMRSGELRFQMKFIKTIAKAFSSAVHRWRILKLTKTNKYICLLHCSLLLYVLDDALYDCKGEKFFGVYDGSKVNDRLATHVRTVSAAAVITLSVEIQRSFDGERNVI